MFLPRKDKPDGDTIHPSRTRRNHEPIEGRPSLCARCRGWGDQTGVGTATSSQSAKSVEHDGKRSTKSHDKITGFTLVELLISMTIASLLSVVLGGLVVAVNAAWQHTRNLEDANLQAQAAIERINYMVSQAGVYQVEGRSTRLGIAVATHHWYFLEFPDALVIWSGGASGGMASRGVQNRLPTANELVVYAADPDDASRLVEFTFPNRLDEIDFDGSRLTSQIDSLIASKESRKTLLSDRMRTTQLPGVRRSKASAFGDLRFELTQTPSDSDLREVVPGTDEWRGLRWCQGIVSDQTGLRQARLRIELQLDRETADNTRQNIDPLRTTSIPFFGSASYRYAYRF